MNGKNLETYCSKAVAGGATDARPIEPASIVTAPWVRMKCQFGCLLYGRSYCCPPHTPTAEETRRTIDSYEKAILLHLEWRATEDREEIENLFRVIVDLERELVLDGHYKAFSMLACHCMLCQECNLLKNLPCQFPDRARPSMEACGIDVYQTARNNGFEVKPLRESGEMANIFGLILVE